MNHKLESRLQGEISTTSDMQMHACMLCHFSCAQFFATLWTIARQALLSMGFSRQKYWSGLPFPSPMHETAYFSLLLSCSGFHCPVILLNRIHHSPFDKINEFHAGHCAVNRSCLVWRVLSSCACFCSMVKRAVASTQRSFLFLLQPCGLHMPGP